VLICCFALQIRDLQQHAGGEEDVRDHSGRVHPLKSCISEEENGMGRALLEVVSSKIVHTKEDVAATCAAPSSASSTPWTR